MIEKQVLSTAAASPTASARAAEQTCGLRHGVRHGSSHRPDHRGARQAAGGCRRTSAAPGARRASESRPDPAARPTLAAAVPRDIRRVHRSAASTGPALGSPAVRGEGLCRESRLSRVARRAPGRSAGSGRRLRPARSAASCVTHRRPGPAVPPPREQDPSDQDSPAHTPRGDRARPHRRPACCRPGDRPRAASVPASAHDRGQAPTSRSPT